MKASTLVCGVCLFACASVAQNTNGVPVQTTNAPVPVLTPVPVVAAAPFISPPTLNLPAITSDVVVVENVVTTNIVTTLTTNRVQRHVQAIATNATLRRFVIDIDANQTPTRFTSILSDGSMVVTDAGSVASLSNRPAVSAFNGMLGDVFSNGRRYTNAIHAFGAGTNAARNIVTHVSGTNQWRNTGR